MVEGCVVVGVVVDGSVVVGCDVVGSVVVAGGVVVLVVVSLLPGIRKTIARTTTTTPTARPIRVFRFMLVPPKCTT